jgi:hypothetical protein
MPNTLADRRHWAKITDICQRLTTLDAVWTDHLSRPVDPRDVPELRHLTHDMDALLSELEPEMDWVQANISPSDDALLEPTLAQLKISDQDKQKLRDYVARQGGVSRGGKAHALHLKQEVPNEKRTLKDKMQKIEAGHHVPGDISARCGLSFIFFIGGMATGAFPVAGAGAAGILMFCVTE